MTTAKTLLQLAGADLNPPRLGEAALVLIDIQNEYLAGPLALPDARPAIARATALLTRARASGAAIRADSRYNGRRSDKCSSTRQVVTRS